MEIDNLKREKDKYVTKVFWLGLKIALIFAVPAIIGVFIGKRLDLYYGTPKTITYFTLLFTFILSWVITIVMYKNLSNKIKKIEKDILTEKQKEQN